jgi:hypothetical protein
MSGQLHATAALPQKKEPLGTLRIGGWVSRRSGLDDVKKSRFLTLPGLELLPLGRPARNQSLYRLQYHGFTYVTYRILLLSLLFNSV